MRLSPAAFNRHFQHMGTSFYHRRAYVCPCVSPSSQAPDASCPNCDGKGVTWSAEAGPYKVGYTMQTAKRSMDKYGSFEPGDAVLSIGSDTPIYAAGHNDRFRSVNSTSPFSFNLRHGFNDRLNGKVVAIERVFYRDPTTKAEIECVIPTVDSDGVLTFGAGVTPPNGAFYSVTGTRYDEFFAYMALPQDRPMHDADLPRKLPVRRFDVFGR